ncbi:MAG: hypothetical protein U0992_05495 [Planctomycetaceae bacterium]
MLTDELAQSIEIDWLNHMFIESGLNRCLHILRATMTGEGDEEHAVSKPRANISRHTKTVHFRQAKVNNRQLRRFEVLPVFPPRHPLQW